MFISVGIPTYNRADLLDQTLEKMHELSIPEDVQWELIVVNNNSTDQTDQVITKHKPDLPIRHLFEKNPGRSHALNKAVSEIKGDYIIWTDDDSLVDKKWIENYVEAFRLYPDVSIFFGPVRPYFEGNPPDWMSVVLDRIPFVYAILDLGKKSIDMTEDTMPFGVNLAFRSTEQKKYLFDTDLGRKPNNFMGGEEYELVQKMLASGLKGKWIPTAVVQHYIPRDRQTIKYLRKYCRGWGEYEGRNEPKTDGRHFLGKPLWRWRKAVLNELKYIYKKMFYGPETWMDDLIYTSKDWGRLVGSTKRPVIRFIQMVSPLKN